MVEYYRYVIQEKAVVELFTLDRRQQIILIVVIAIVLFGGGYKYARWQQEKSQETPTINRTEPGESPGNVGQEVVVHVGGAVEKPGVYNLPRGSRVNDAVQKAGAMPEADLNALNLAAVLTDGQKITVPYKPQHSPGQATTGLTGSVSSRGGAGEQPVAKENPSLPGGLVNINTATKAELESLPGIGPSLAERIIEYREKNGPFLTPEDIKNVSGIGEKRFEQLKDKITT